MTDAELAAMRRPPAGPGRGISLSRFVAEVALAAAGVTGQRPPAGRAPSCLVFAELMEAVAAVNRVGNNLNQLARARTRPVYGPVGSRQVEVRVLAALDRLADVADRAHAGPL